MLIIFPLARGRAPGKISAVRGAYSYFLWEHLLGLQHMDILAADMSVGGPVRARTDYSFDKVAERMLPLGRLDADEDALRARFQAGKPFAHVVMDGYFDDEVLDRVVAEFPKGGHRDWITWDNKNEIKQTSRGIAGLPPFTQLLFLQLCSEPFLERLRRITGMSDLIWDPLFHGAGLHESRRGGWLNMHADWTRHPLLPLKRRLNLIIYLNRGWHESWGGDLELWDSHTRACGARVVPLFNRAVLFPTTEETLHGFPAPMSCPDGEARRSICMFYWSADREEVKKAQQINFLPGSGATRRTALIRSLLPPIIFNQLMKQKMKHKVPPPGMM